MASGDILCMPELVPVTGSGASMSFRAGGAAVDVSMPILEFDASAVEYAGYRGMLPPGWNGAAIKVRVTLRAVSATSGNVVMQAAFRRYDAADDIDASHTYSWQAVTVAVGGTAGYPTYGEIAFTQAQADALAGGDEFALLLRRKADDAGDTASGDVHITAVVIVQA